MEVRTPEIDETLMPHLATVSSNNAPQSYIAQLLQFGEFSNFMPMDPLSSPTEGKFRVYWDGTALRQ